MDDLLESSGEIDVYVIHGEKEGADSSPSRTLTSPPTRLPYFAALGLVSLTGSLAYGLRFLRVADAAANTVMLFLAGVAWTAFRYGRGPAVFASILAVLVFDFFFVPPFHTFAVADAQYVVTFAVMLTIGIVISTLTSRLRAQIESTRQRERRTSSLYELGKQLSSLYGNVFLVGAAGNKVAEMLGGEVAIYLRQPSSTPELAFGHETTIAQHAVRSASITSSSSAKSTWTNLSSKWWSTTTKSGRIRGKRMKY